ncbi:MAG: hypothetical protein CYG59_16075 [Chloroflexi bacterium]|nr:MAG: hypothetical protein CYG59_16075 [Chloroflexota bacterium]
MTTHWFHAQPFAYAQPFQAVEDSQTVENPATAIDRAFIADQGLSSDTKGDMCTYDRTPVADEWLDTMPDGAFVRVFIINEFTTVRALYNQAGDRLTEPVIDTWRPTAHYVVAS